MGHKWSSNVVERGLVNYPHGAGAGLNPEVTLVSRCLDFADGTWWLTNLKAGGNAWMTKYAAPVPILLEFPTFKPAGAGSPFPYGWTVEPDGPV